MTQVTVDQHRAIAPHTWPPSTDYVRRSQRVHPQLAAGDRLTRAEFERRYRAAPHIKKAELIEGVVFMPSAAHAAFLQRIQEGR